jgi:hypothetical protein
MLTLTVPATAIEPGARFRTNLHAPEVFGA